MPENLETVRNEVRQDLSPRWLTLSNQVRERTNSIRSKSASTELSAETAALAIDTEELCAHFERVHADVDRLLGMLNNQTLSPTEPKSQIESTSSPTQVLLAQEKDHMENDSLKDVIKALFMWRDDPAEITVNKD